MKTPFWQGKTVLITGASGFIGTHLTSHLRTLGATVVALSRKQTDESIVACDVTSLRQLEAVFGRAPLYACYHLAAESLVESGQVSPYKTFKNNFLGTLNVLDLSRKYQVERIVIASTVHVYGNAPAPTSEEVAPRPSRPYETSKTNTDLIAQSYADSYGLPVVIPRFVNVYGPGDMNFSRLIPKTIRSVVNGTPPLLWGGSARRDFLYIDDAIDAFLALGSMDGEKLAKNRIYNFGTGNIVTVRDVVEKIMSLAGMKTPIEQREEGRVGEVAEQFVTWEKAKTLVGWTPQTSLSTGLAKTIDWYRATLLH